jgi:hypothetical protein
MVSASIVQTGCTRHAPRSACHPHFDDALAIITKPKAAGYFEVKPLTIQRWIAFAQLRSIGGASIPMILFDLTSPNLTLYTLSTTN